MRVVVDLDVDMDMDLGVDVDVDVDEDEGTRMVSEKELFNNFLVLFIPAVCPKSYGE